jgi:adenylate kinase
MGSKSATKWESKQKWLEGRGSSADSSTSDDASASGPVNIIIAGAPASGKGTQCETIKEEFGIVHLSTGDMLRAAVAAGTEVGVQAKEFMDSGKLVPDEVIIGIISDRLLESDCQEQGWLLDGFPRTAAQAEALADAGCTADCFLFLDVPDEVLVERVVGRRTDPETGKIYHTTFSPPPADDEELINRLEHRSDDTEEKVVVRLEQFHANVAAVKGSYEDIMISVDGNRAPADVSADIMESVKAAVAKRA